MRSNKTRKFPADSQIIFRKNGALYLPFLLLLSIFCVLIFHLPKPTPPQFIMSSDNASAATTIATPQPQFNYHILPQPQFLLAAHSATVTVLPNGHLLALWFAGSHEGKADVKIWQSQFDGDKWSMAKIAVSPMMIAKATHRYIKKVGNPVVYLASNGVLHLFVVSVSVGGWSGSSLNHFISRDQGNTWIDGKKIVLSPLLNLSTLVRTNAITLSDGGFYLPVYHELMRTYPEILRFDKDGNFIEQIRLTNHNTLLQPTLLPLNSTNALAYMRNNGRENNLLYYQQTQNGGSTWGNIIPTNLTNPDSSLVVGRIKESQYIMVHNLKNREQLSLAVSSDGKQWRDIYLLENSKNTEFSYPALQIHDGIIDILYTWKRLNIKHVRFNQSWLEKQILHGAANAG